MGLQNSKQALKVMVFVVFVVPDSRKGFKGNVFCGFRDLFMLLGEVGAGGGRGVGMCRLLISTNALKVMV